MSLNFNWLPLRSRIKICASYVGTRVRHLVGQGANSILPMSQGSCKNNSVGGLNSKMDFAPFASRCLECWVSSDFCDVWREANSRWKLNRAYNLKASSVFEFKSEGSKFALICVLASVSLYIFFTLLRWIWRANLSLTRNNRTVPISNNGGSLRVDFSSCIKISSPQPQWWNHRKMIVSLPYSSPSFNNYNVSATILNII